MAGVFVIGIGYKPLDERSRETMTSAVAIYASERLLSVFKRYEEFPLVRDKIVVINNVDETLNAVKIKIQSRSADRGTIVILASGDPLFYGIGRRVIEEFGRETVQIIPDLSSVQWAFARIREPWDRALLISLHGGPDPAKRRELEYQLSEIPRLIMHHERVAILTDSENNPGLIAETLLESAELQQIGEDSVVLHVCENLGYPDEKISEGTPGEITQRSFGEPNVVIITRREPPHALRDKQT